MDNISMINNHVDVAGATSIVKVYGLIKDNASPYRATIEEIRQLYSSGSADQAGAIKKSLKGFTCSGIFRNRRTTKNLDSYSGMLILDLDDLLPAAVKQIKAIIEAMPYTYICFISPSGLGIKIIVKVNSIAENHKTAYEQVKSCYEEETGEKFDKTCDVARLTYISYDPDAFLNENSAVFQVNISKAKKTTSPIARPEIKNMGTGELAECFENAITFTEQTHSFQEGSRNNFIFQLACNANRHGIPVEYALDACTERYAESWDEQEIMKIVSGAYNRYSEQFNTWINYKAEKSNPVIKAISEEQADEHPAEKTPVIPQSIIDKMPSIIKDIAKMLTSERERDTFITGALCVIGGCFNKVQGNYHGNIVHPNLYSFIIAPASSGKGALRHARSLGNDLHKKLLEQSKKEMKEFEVSMREHKTGKSKGGEVPEKPPFKMLFIPGNSSVASIYDHLNESNGLGVICETEADTLSGCFKNEWGNYSDMLRKIFHHETVSMRRKTDNRYIEVQNPRLSVALSGTASQVKEFIKSAENGLFSRFLFYRFQEQREWHDVSPATGKDILPSLVKEKSEELTKIAEYLNCRFTDVHFTEKQWQDLNKQFGKWTNSVSCFLSEEAAASVFRLGLIAFRLAMILTAIRKFELKSDTAISHCTDEHFMMVMQMVDIYLRHAIIMYKELPTTQKSLSGKLKNFYDSLPFEFTRENAKATAKSAGLDMSDSWIDRWLKRFITFGYLVKADYNMYRKVVSKKENEVPVIESPRDTATILIMGDPKEKTA